MLYAEQRNIDFFVLEEHNLLLRLTDVTSGIIECLGIILLGPATETLL